MKTLFLLPVVTALLAGCTKDDVDPDGLVPATQEGKDTGDFLVNDVAFSPRSRTSWPGGSLYQPGGTILVEDREL